jgi:hypothetical protein
VGSNGLIQTAASGAARFDHNPETGESLGLLVEEARTNLLLYGNDLSAGKWASANSYLNATLAANVSIAPSVSPLGLTTTSSITLTSTDGRITYYSNPVSAGAYNFSVFVKSNGISSVSLGVDVAYAQGYTIFNLSSGTVTSGLGTIQRFSNGWYRLSTYAILSTYPRADCGISFSGTSSQGLYVCGAQLEAGAFPTSYIPTTTATVTRAADVVGMMGTNFSSWYNQAGGTVLINYKRYPVSTFTYPTPWMIRDSVGGAYLNGIQVFGEAGATYDRLSGTNFTATPSVTLPNPYSRQDKNAAAFINGSQNMAVNGTIGTASSSNIYTSGTVNQLVIGQNFTYKSFAYYPVRLPDAQLQALTS